jgi:hypothetical protein
MEIDMHVEAMLSTHPRVHGQTDSALIEYTELCFDCAQACTACADACLGEPDLDDLRQCIRMNLDCADVCFATGTLGTRRTGSDERIVELMLAACAEACHVCGDECARHSGHHEHCRICADICRSCERACLDAIKTLEVH